MLPILILYTLLLLLQTGFHDGELWQKTATLYSSLVLGRSATIVSSSTQGKENKMKVVLHYIQNPLICNNIHNENIEITISISNSV